jgi:hypothetical protein
MTIPRTRKGVPAGGEFASHTRTSSTIELESDSQSGWSPHPELVTLIESPVGGARNYWVHLADGGQQVFDISRDLEGEDADFDSLTITRNGDKVTVTAGLASIDFTQAAGGDADDEEAGGEYLTEHQNEIETYLADKYGVVVDTATDWDFSSLAISMDYSDWTETDTDGALCATTANAIGHLSAFTSLDSLTDDIQNGEFFAGLKRQLDINELSTYDNLSLGGDRALVYSTAVDNEVHEWGVCSYCAEKTPRTHQLQTCLVCGNR